MVECLFGGENMTLQPRRVDSLGLAYGFTTQALVYRMNRHEGKLTGLAAFGEPSVSLVKSSPPLNFSPNTCLKESESNKPKP